MIIFSVSFCSPRFSTSTNLNNKNSSLILTLLLSVSPYAHLNLYDMFAKKVKGFDNIATKYFEEYDKLKEFVNNMNNSEVKGIHVIYNKDIFKAGCQKVKDSTFRSLMWINSFSKTSKTHWMKRKGMR